MTRTAKKNGQAPHEPVTEQLEWDLGSRGPVATADEELPDHPLPLQEHLHQLWLALGLDDE